MISYELREDVKTEYIDNEAALFDARGNLLIFNETASVALKAMQAKRSIDEIAALLSAEYEIAPDAAYADIGTLFERLAEQGITSKSSPDER